MSRCLWCGDPYDGAEQFCELCMASGANPNVDRFKPHTVHTGQFFEVDFDLFCGRLGIKDAPLDFEPTPEQLQGVADAVDRAILGTAFWWVKGRLRDKARPDQRSRETVRRSDRGVSEADRREHRDHREERPPASS